MTNRSKARGTAWETAVVRYLNDHGFPHVERRSLRGGRDRGDIAGIPGLVLECKDEKTIELAGYLDELMTETANADTEHGAVIVKRRRRPVGDGYAVMDLARYAVLLKMAGF